MKSVNEKRYPHIRIDIDDFDGFPNIYIDGKEISSLKKGGIVSCDYKYVTDDTKLQPHYIKLKYFFKGKDNKWHFKNYQDGNFDTRERQTADDFLQSIGMSADEI